jgi:hypothetical protein
VLGSRAFQTAQLQGNRQGTSVNEIMNLCFFFLISSLSMLIFTLQNIKAAISSTIQINIQTHDTLLNIKKAHQ